MKNNFLSFITAALAFLSVNAFAQDSKTNSLNILKMEIDVLKQQQQLLDAKMMLWEEKQKSSIMIQQPDATKPKDIEKISSTVDSLRFTHFRNSVKLNPQRLFEGTFQVSYEHAFTKNFALEIAGMGTYVTKNGLGKSYFGDQSFSFTSSTGSQVFYSGEMISGWGITVQPKNYILAKINPDISAPLGFYAAPLFMYRKIWLTGREYKFDSKTKETTTIDVTQNLDVIATGLTIGGKFTISKVICMDVYAGGMMRLSWYSSEKKFTKYKSWNQIDYSGILPVAGISIGILK